MSPTPQFINPDYRPAQKLQGKVALVTGGDSGIGRAVCYLFALEGATVAFTYVKVQEDRDAQETLQMIRKTKKADVKDTIAIAADLGFDDNCRRVVEEVAAAFGRIDILVNNAAEQHKSSSIEEVDDERLERVFRTNMFSYFHLTRSINFRFLFTIYISVNRFYLSILNSDWYSIRQSIQTFSQVYEAREQYHKHNIHQCIQGKQTTDRVYINKGSYSSVHKINGPAACTERD